MLENILQKYLQNISNISNKNEELERLSILINDAVPKPSKHGNFEKDNRVKVLMAIATCRSFELYVESGGKDFLSLSVLGKKLSNDGFEPYLISLAMNDWISALGLDELGARFVKENPGKTIDYLTGLTWKTYALGQGTNKSPTQFSTVGDHYREISNALEDYPDWRLPSKEELLTLIRCKSGYLGLKDVPDGNADEPAIHPEAFAKTDPRFAETDTGEDYLTNERISGVNDGRYYGYGMVHFGSFNPGSYSLSDGRCFIRLVKR